MGGQKKRTTAWRTTPELREPRFSHRKSLRGPEVHEVTLASERHLYINVPYIVHKYKIVCRCLWDSNQSLRGPQCTSDSRRGSPTFLSAHAMVRCTPIRGVGCFPCRA